MVMMVIVTEAETELEHRLRRIFPVTLGAHGNGAALVMAGGTCSVPITIENACVATGDTPLDAVTVPEKVPATVGEPVTAPVLAFS